MIPLRLNVFAWLVMAVSAPAPRFVAVQAPRDRFLLACSVFTPTTTEAELRARFGSANVTTALVPDAGGAEGDRAEGTILFATVAEARAEISWEDASKKRVPLRVGVSGNSTRWHTSAGIVIGTDLLTLEKLNGRPFVLDGFDGESSGLVTSWSGGKLTDQDSGSCHVRIALRPAATRKNLELIRGVKGASYSSSNSVMRTVNPMVSALFIQRW